LLSDKTPTLEVQPYTGGTDAGDPYSCPVFAGPLVVYYGVALKFCILAVA